MHLIVAGFGDVPVLAEEAAHVAAGGSHAEDAGARQKMVQRFFLDGIDLQNSRRAVTQAVQLSALVDADKTEARLAGVYVAMARTEKAMHTAVGLGFPPAGFVERVSFLQDCELRHRWPVILLYAFAKGSSRSGGLVVGTPAEAQVKL